MSFKRLLTALAATIFLLFFVQNTFAQSKDYHTEWLLVDGFTKKGLPQSALQEVEKIYNDAKKTDNQPQLIKALLFKIQISQEVQEDATIKSIENVVAEIDQAKAPSKNVLQSILAEMYWNYYQQNRYKILDRTFTNDEVKADIETWTIKDFNQKISELYQQSLLNGSLLKNTKLDGYDAIILKGNARFLRPTLYDLLAHRALDYFKNDEKNLPRPAYHFQISDVSAFSPAEQFINASISTKDTAAMHYKALLLYKDLLQFHKNDLNKDPFLDVDLDRLAFVYQYSTHPDKDSLYLSSLKNIYAKYPQYSSGQMAGYLQANLIKNLSRAYTDSNSSYTLVKAKALAEEIFKKYPKSNAGIYAETLLNDITGVELSMTTEKVNEVNKPFRSLITFKNVGQIYLRIIPVTESMKIMMDTESGNDIFKKIVAEKPIRSWLQALPMATDYQSHSTEIKIDGLAPGQYILLASNHKDFNAFNNALALQTFYVSNISYINHGDEYFVLDRTTGFPLKNASVKVSIKNYNYNSRKYEYKSVATLTSDEKGYFKLPVFKKDYNSQVQLNFSYKKDFLKMDDDYYVYYSSGYPEKETYKSQEESDKVNGKVFFFTDRSIYRPGQKVYFKGIAVTKDAKTNRSILLKKADSLTVYLRDPNYQMVDSLKVGLNEFSSFGGSFMIPENNLNGKYALQIRNINNAYTLFSVEEYKRPKFVATMESPMGTYHVNDTITVMGNAKAYAGNNIGGAEVKYRVTRLSRFLYPWYYWKRGLPSSPAMEITEGTTTTDSDGQFKISFKAIPDAMLNKNTLPVFDYMVEADITDITGETRSASISVPAGYHSVNLEIIMPSDGINKDSTKKITVTTQNLAGEKISSKVEVKIYQLVPPKRLIRERLWATPDLFVMSKNEFISYFPHDEYRDETKKESWDKGKLMMDKELKIDDKENISISGNDYSPGWYVIEAVAHDPSGQEVKNIKYFEVYRLNEKSNHWEYLSIHTNGTEFQPGEMVKVFTATGADSVFLISQTMNRDTSLKSGNSFDFTRLNQKSKIFEYPITEKSRGGFGLNQFFVKDNRYYFTNHTFNVPWTNKDLQISFDTYREKTLPGSHEKWKVKIAGSKGDQVSAEMLTTMYDASLDQFQPHQWQKLNVWPNYFNSIFWRGNENFNTAESIENFIYKPGRNVKDYVYDQLNYLPTFYYPLYGKVRGVTTMMKSESREDVDYDGVTDSTVTTQFTPPTIQNDEEVMAPPPPKTEEVTIRKNFNETAFFFPQLKTDSAGNISFEFTMPEALTQWKILTLAHTKDLSSGYLEKTVVTQKDLMVQTNMPRFVREGDHMQLIAKVVNLSTKTLAGTATLHVLNATTLVPIDQWFKNNQPLQNFSVEPGQSVPVHFNIDIPEGFNDVFVYRIIVQSENMSDGEEAYIPVVTNRMLVTETMPLPMKGNGSKNFLFEKLIQSGNSFTLKNFGLTVEYTSNPAWLAIQALPYLASPSFECSDFIFNQFYANAIAAQIVQSTPKIKAVFEKWKNLDTTALMSNLEKNQELKSVLLEETPWVLQSKNENEQKKNIALLFDALKMHEDLKASLEKLKSFQTPNGGFSWFNGGPDDRYTTQRIVSGLGHLKHLGALPAAFQTQVNEMLVAALRYLDNRLTEDYDQIVKSKQKLTDNHLSQSVVQYLYARSFFDSIPISTNNQIAFDYYRGQSQKFWLSQSKYMRAMIALSLYRTNDNITPKEIIKSLKENAIQNDEMGMYWKEWTQGGYWWYQAPIESQALMIEAFQTIDGNINTVAELKTWLLKNKQTNHWKTSRATADAVYALLLQGNDWLTQEKNIQIQLGGYVIESKNEVEEAGTGYFKKKIDGDKVAPSMGKIKVTVANQQTTQENENVDQSPSWGAVYWQYFENLDKITFAETPLKLSKKLYLQKNTPAGPQLTLINDATILNVGDKITVRIELRVDRDMEYVHMKDMRAAGLEPLNVMSGYKWQGGLGYYETTKDVSTHFFFNRLSKGTYVFEYPLVVAQAGDFSNGITTIQSMYAPEFTAHSEGVRIQVQAK